MEEDKKTISFRIWSINRKHYFPSSEKINDYERLHMHALQKTLFEIDTHKNCFQLKTNQDYIIEQYYDLFDKNGNQVCEGDIIISIIHFKNSPDIISPYLMIINNSFPVSIEPLAEIKNEIYIIDMEKSLDSKNLEIVGNINEDPDLKKSIKYFNKFTKILISKNDPNIKIIT